jgi:hypothetical protein
MREHGGSAPTDELFTVKEPLFRLSEDIGLSYSMGGHRRRGGTVGRDPHPAPHGTATAGRPSATAGTCPAMRAPGTTTTASDTAYIETHTSGGTTTTPTSKPASSAASGMDLSHGRPTLPADRGTWPV